MLYMDQERNVVERDMTAAEVADILRCKPRKVWTEAAKHGIGANLGGRAGWRFTRADVDALRAALRAAPAPSQRRRRRSA